MEVIHDRLQGTITLSQHCYIEMILDCFGLKDGQSVSTPLETNAKLTKIDMPEVDAKMYQSALSGLMYAMLVMHPDLAYAVGALSKHTACPGQAHCAERQQTCPYWVMSTQIGLVTWMTATQYLATLSLQPEEPLAGCQRNNLPSLVFQSPV